MKKTKILDPDFYQQTTQALFDHIQATPHLPVDYQNWNIQGAMPQDSVLLFIDHVHMPGFEPWHDFACKTIKLLNYAEPAFRITMFLTHRYELKRADKLSPRLQKKAIQQAIDALTEQRKNLIQKREHPFATLSEVNAEIRAVEERLDQWRSYQEQADQYEVALSNYERYYMYHSMSYKYQSVSPKGQPVLANRYVHLIKTQVDGNATQPQTRYNILFVDQDRLVKPAPYQHKTIHTYLDTFPDKQAFPDNRGSVYIRPKAVPQADAPKKKTPKPK